MIPVAVKLADFSASKPRASGDDPGDDVPFAPTIE